MAAPSGYELEFTNFFKLSDDPNRNEEWVECFCPDATVVMGEAEAQGTEKIRQLRDGMWETVASRKHTLYSFSGGMDINPVEKGERLFMLTGQVDYGLKTGETKAARWSAHGKLKEDADRVRFLYYKVKIHA
ncbi:hypothetical protein PG988_014972 [Apiospora saccharicola]